MSMETSREPSVVYDDGRATMIQADVFDGIRFLKDTGVLVDCVVTSPPYW